MKARVSMGGESAGAGRRPTLGLVVAAIALTALAVFSPIISNSVQQPPADPGELVYQEFCAGRFTGRATFAGSQCGNSRFATGEG